MAPALLLAIVGCTSPGANLEPLPDAPPGAYRLGGGDQVRILVFGEDQLSGEYRVNDSGRIAMPLLGAVPAAGKTTAELEKTVADGLKKAGMVRSPSVAAEVM